MLVNALQIENATRRLRCANEYATAFFVSEAMILTAYHAVIDHEPGNDDIVIYEQDGSVSVCNIVRSFPESDLCLLSVAMPCKYVLPLRATVIKVGERCHIFGYPYKTDANNLSLTGSINKIQTAERADFVVGDLNIDSNFDYEGLSGAAVIINGCASGVVLRQTDDRLAVISIEKIQAVLASAGIVIGKEYDYQQVPEEFREAINSATPNYLMLRKIDEAFNSVNSWFILKGTPGSGKSTLIAGYQPEDKHLVICGKYFVKVPDDKAPSTLRTSPEFFLEWIEDLVSRTITGLPHAKPEGSFEQRSIRVAGYFEELNSFYKKKDQTGVIMIDGLDEVDDLKRFLSILPNQTPSHLKLLLSHSNAVLPMNIRALTGDQTIVVTPIDQGQCEAFITGQLGRDILKPAKLQQLAQKSEGHPLYLRYLVNYIKQYRPSASIEEMDSWIDQIPVIQGDIVNYYDAIWESIFQVPEKLWILILLSRLRQAVPKQTLYEILPDHVKMTFTSYLPAINYLLNSGKRLEIYHSSFKEYISLKTAEQTRLAHDQIALFCTKQPVDLFTINNKIYHLIQGSNPVNGVENCTQQWADHCAQYNVEPDLVLLDIKQVMAIATGLQLATETVRLLLLLERVGFRYDKVFSENAIQLAETLIAMRQYDAGIRYLVRNGILQVSGTEATDFLRLLYHHEAFTEAERLEEAIHSAFRLQFQEMTDTGEGITFSLFRMELLAYSLSMNRNPETGSAKFYAMLNWLRAIRRDAENEGAHEAAEDFTDFITSVLAWQNAYVMIQFGHYVSPDILAERAGQQMTEKWSTRWANMILNIKEMHDHRTGKVLKDENYRLLVADIEKLITSVGYTKDNDSVKRLFSALYEDSQQPELLTLLVNDYTFKTEIVSIRDNNLVDADYPAFHEIYFQSLTQGYTDIAGNYPLLLRTNYRHEDWEPWMLSVIRKIAFIEGKLNRMVTANSSDGSLIIQELLTVIHQIDFTFDERSYWEKAYHLPENLMPILYFKLARMLVMFSPGDVKILLKHVKERSGMQLGLYTEGFRESLYQIVRVLIEYNYSANEILIILDLWRLHTLDGVINRWERTPELLRLTEMLALIAATEKANETYKSMLDTSMGPNWYKDSQFELINIALRLPLDKPEKRELFRQSAGVLDAASGEMTFQNYIRYDKQSFVGTLAEQLDLASSISYFKNELLPEPLTLIANAESSQGDAPRKGDGYHLGARNVNEQGALPGILKNARTSSPYVRWALAETLVINDDTFRYASQYAKTFAVLLNELEALDSPHLPDLYEVIAALNKTKELNEPNIYFLEYFGELLTDSNLSALQQTFDQAKTKVRLAKKQESDNTSFEERERPLLNFNKKFSGTGGADRFTLIQEGLQAFKETKTSLLSVWSETSRFAQKNLRALLQNSVEVIQVLGTSISEDEAEPWRVANKLLWYLDATLNGGESLQINKVILEHFEYVVRPGQVYYEKYDWLLSDLNEDKKPDLQLMALLKWLLVYPLKLIRERAYTAFKELCRREPDLTLTELIAEAITEDISFPAETCARLLHDIVDRQPTILIGYFERHPERLASLKNIHHFTVAKLYLDIGIKLNGYGYGALYEVIKSLFPQTIIVTGEVALEEDFLSPIDDIIEELNHLQLLNRTFCEKLLNGIKQYTAPVTVSDYRRSDKYLKRSFYDNENYDGRFPQVLRYVLNTAIMPRVEYGQIGNIYDIVNS